MITNDKLIVALDVETSDRALALVDQLKDSVGMSFGSTDAFQISRQLFFASRLLKTICTGASGAGKRKDSLKLRMPTRLMNLIFWNTNGC